MFNFTQGQITRIINSPMYKLELKRLEEAAEDIAVDVKRDLEHLSRRATEILAEQMHQKAMDEKIRQNAAFGVLDRAGYGKKDRPISVHGDVYNTQITEVNVKEMSDKELRDDVLDLIEESDGNYAT